MRRNLQKVKEVNIRIFYAKNGHFIETKKVNSELEAKRYIEKLAKEKDKELWVDITDNYNSLFYGNIRPNQKVWG